MTIKQKQCLLCYLGYYEGSIDGIWGDKSAQATKSFQEDYGLDADGIFGAKTEEMILDAVYGKAKRVDFWNGIKHFTRDEFMCNCGCKHCNGFPVEPNKQLIKIADQVRDYFKAPAYVSSGIRCKTHNANIGGVSNSRHLLGKAMDFRIKGKSSAQVLAYVQTLPGIRYSYAIDNNYIHMDVL